MLITELTIQIYATCLLLQCYYVELLKHAFIRHCSVRLWQAGHTWDQGKTKGEMIVSGHVRPWHINAFAFTASLGVSVALFFALHVEHASTLRACQRVVVDNVSISAGRMVRGKKHFSPLMPSVAQGQQLK